MASQGPRYSGTAASLANAGTSENANAWTTPGNVGADDGAEATITAATYDSPDISEILVASNFGFTIPDGSTIDGIVVEIERRDQAIGAASDNRVQLAKGTTFADLVGSNKADTTLDWPTAATVKSYGTGTTDLWGATWTAAEVNASSFAVFLSVQADAANTDIFVDFIRVTVYYTLVPVSATPGTASLVLTTFAPTVAAPRLVTPTTSALTTAAFAPTVTVTNNVLVTPGVAALVLTRFSPTVTASDHKLVTPTTAALTLTRFAPTVTTPRLVIPGLAALTLSTFAPTVTAGGAPPPGDTLIAHISRYLHLQALREYEEADRRRKRRKKKRRPTRADLAALL